MWSSRNERASAFLTNAECSLDSYNCLHEVEVWSATRQPKAEYITGFLFTQQHACSVYVNVHVKWAITSSSIFRKKWNGRKSRCRDLILNPQKEAPPLSKQNQDHWQLRWIIELIEFITGNEFGIITISRKVVTFNHKPHLRLIHLVSSFLLTNFFVIN